MFKVSKNWKLFLSICGLGLWVIILRKLRYSNDNRPMEQNKMTRSVKLNEIGEYQPFYGYTSLSMVEHPEELGEKIESFIRTSSLGLYFSPLPHQSYHMTIFNIYTMKLDFVIPSVEKWVKNHNGIIPNNSWLPEEVLLKQNTEATKVLSSYPPTSGIKELSLYSPFNGRALKIHLVLKDDFNHTITQMRNEMTRIYEHNDDRLTKFHITLAYPFKQPEYSKQINVDLNTLREMIKPLLECRLINHGVYLYDSMTNFILWKNQS